MIFYNRGKIPATEIQHSALFRASGLCSFIIHDDYIINHDYLNHKYTMIGYPNIDIHGYIYRYSSVQSPVNSVGIVTSVHDTPVVTTGGNKGERRKAPEVDAVTGQGANPSEAQLMMVYGNGQ
ncbi:Metal transporter Nramp2 [Hordeum vulgare]|nr:Metal transporter Nramp2 [Hordeum vulgare]